ncbi:MAG TPA: substrate-binding domain-containing protein, partial [Casimicrobiaceae bacterium]|nr:substrate-binding domain-containing protein [Casimicrobiaceae bacterium]
MKPRPHVRWLASFIAAAALLFAIAAAAADVRVLISAGFYQAYSQLVPEFERSTGHHLITVRGPSLGDSPEAIPNRLKRGEPCDVVVMQGDSIDNLAKQQLVRGASKVDFARSEIGMVVRAGGTKPDISS